MGILDSLQNVLAESTEFGRQIDQLMNDDAVAGKTSWEEVRSPGSRSTHKFKEISSARIEFKPDFSALLKPIFFMLLTVGGIGSFAVKLQEIPLAMLIVASIIALSAVAATVNKFYRGTTPVVFDQTIGCYWKSRQQPGHGDISENKNACLLNDIHAIQVIRSSSTSNSSSGRSNIFYQLNLVKEDGSRLNVTSTRNKSQLELSAEEVSKFLSAPVWNFATHSVM